MTLRQYLEGRGFSLVESSYYTHIRKWRAWYRGKVPSFHNYSIYNSGKRKRRTRASLKMAKQGCETWANLLWNYECGVSVEDYEAADRLLQETLTRNNFWEQTNKLTEKAFALGTGAYILYPVDGETQIDYVTAEYIYPLTWRNGKIESCAFAAGYTEGKRQLLYLMIHEKQPGGGYNITNVFFQRQRDSDEITEVPAPVGIQPVYTSRARRFAIITPNIANNIADVPMGLSVYANHTDTLQNIDLAFDGVKVSMELGRPRMGVTNTMMQVDLEDSGLVERFDPNDLAVYDMGAGLNEQPVDTKDLTVPYRAADFEGSLQTQLNIYSQNLGLGDKAFKWERGSVLTAKQVISDDAAMLRTMEKHQEGLRVSVTDVALAVLDIAGINVDRAQVAVIFDDSVTRDKEADRQRAWQWVTFGRMAFWRYLVDFEGYDEGDAKLREHEALQGLGDWMPHDDLKPGI